MNRSLLALAVLAAGTASAMPFSGNDARSNAMGNTGVASAQSFAAGQFNPALLAAGKQDINFGLLLPSIKLYLDDSKGLLDHSVDFYDKTYDDFENSATAVNNLNAAIVGDGTEPSLTAVITLIIESDSDPTDRVYSGGNIANIQTAIKNIQEDFSNGNQPRQEDLEALEQNTEALTTNSSVLDGKVKTVNSSSNTLNTTFDNMREQLPGFNDKPLVAGLDLGAAFALPRTGLGLGLSINNTTIVGFSVDVVDSDLTLFGQALDDLEGVSAEGSEASGELVVLSSETQTLATLIANRPSPVTQQWIDDLNAAKDAVKIQSDVVETELTDITTFNGNFFTNGSFNEPEPQDLATSVQVLGANIAEVGISIAREFEYLGSSFAAGITPKLQTITVFEDTILIANAQDEIGDDPYAYIESNRTDHVTGNIDLGLAKTWEGVLRGNVRAGLAVKDVIPQTFESTSGSELSIDPKIRIGGAHITRWTTLAADIDVTENQPLKFGVPTRYLGLGAEFNAFNWFKVRGGYRNNLSLTDSHVVSGGIGFTPFGVGFDLSGWFRPDSLDNWDEIVRDAGVVAQFSMEF